MVINAEMDLSELEREIGPYTDFELRSIRATLVEHFDGKQLTDIPYFVLTGYVNYAVMQMPPEMIPGEFFR